MPPVQLLNIFAEPIGAYAYYYPIFMAHFWIVGSLVYYFKWENRLPKERPVLVQYPGVSIVIPCYDEEENVRDTVRWALAQEYPEFEVIAVNDGSRDSTGAILDELAAMHPRLRVVHLAQNQGKAMGLRTAALVSRHEFLVCIDGDAILDPSACVWIMFHFLSNPRVGAVTGNPRVRNRSTLIGKLQVGEFSCIVGMIKRAQRIYGQLFACSGVISAFRKAALHRVGYWSTDMVTEDVDIAWKLQRDHWLVRYEPHAMAWILMPETLKGLWRQRLRWAQGGAEVLMRHAPVFLHWRERRMWPIALDTAASIVWAYMVFLSLVLGLTIALLRADEPGATMQSLLFDLSAHAYFSSLLIVATTVVQLAVGSILDNRYEHGAWKHFVYMVWYPLAFWMIIAFTTLVAVPKAIAKRAGTRAVWVSPDRGLRR